MLITLQTLKKFLQPAGTQTRSVATFFSSATSASPRTPLQTKSANVHIIRKAFTAPRPGSASTPLVKKRVISDGAAKTDIPVKKSRLFGPDENVKATGERSSFFQTPNHVQSRRPLGNVDYQSPLPVDSIKRPTSGAKFPSSVTTLGMKKELADLEKAIKASLTTPKPSSAVEKELTDFELAIKESLSSEYLPPSNLPTDVPAEHAERDDEDTSVKKVARSLKAEFAFKASPPGAAPKKLAKFVERQRVGSTSLEGQLRLQANVRKTGLLQQLRSGPAVKSAQIPHTVDREDSGESQWDDWSIFEDVEENRSTSASASASQSQSQSQGVNKVLGEGGFAKFMLRR